MFRMDKNVIFLGIALGMMIYAIPRLEVGQGLTQSSIFSVIWISFALLVISSNLHYMIGVDKESRMELDKVKRMKRWKMEQMAGRTTRKLQMRK
ncbi:MAG: hypothetical protein A2189_06955 [Paenibacillus sp. RIFOXYA1_FULL_44_5]|nr:MAG: hypothetical protein A2189_06955 [Paenibacillus sp. RIFOXYA1_FULL_44_5]